MSTYTAKQIEAIGGRRWTKGDKDRVYINADIWGPLIGLETSNYNTGNISSATLNGEKISNSRAYDILSCISKVYWDAIDGQIHILVYRNRYSDEVPGWIRKAITQAATALASDDDDQDATSTTDDSSAATVPASTIVTGLRETGRTVREIAAAIGVSVSTIYRWARGICRPRPTNAAALAALA